MKVLWLCNTRFCAERIKGNGSWLQPLAEKIHHIEDIELYNVTLDSVLDIVTETFNGICQYVLPRMETKGFGQIASPKLCQTIIEIEKSISPDIVHIWGTESVWADLHRKGCLTSKTIIDIQGLLAPYTDYYYGGLSFREIIKCIHLKEVLMPWRVLFNKKNIFRKRGRIETQCLKSFKSISVQSGWVRDYVQMVNPTSQLYDTKILIRDSFYSASPWKYKIPSDSPVIFSSCSAAVPYKGMHILLKALGLLKPKYPNIKLHLAGNIMVGSKLVDGYSLYLKKLITKYGLKDNVVLLGSITDMQIIEQLQQCNVCVIPSFVETYCLAFAESMLLGVPTIASYAGAMPELAVPNEEALFYNSIDYFTCATYIDRILNDRSLSERLSSNCRKRRLIENDPEKVLNTQISIYKDLLKA